MGPRGAPDTGAGHVTAEGGLRRSLGTGQLAMIAIGSAIGTGLFLGSGFAIGLAGPAVLISYAIGGAITVLLMAALAEMTIEHPRAGSFGWLAEHMLGPFAGFVTRWSYWAANVLAVGTEVTAVAVYMRFWLPDVPGWIWILAAGGLLVGINLVSVRTYGWAEFAFSTIKVTAILLFLGLGCWTIAQRAAPAGAAIGFGNYEVAGGFFAHGPGGVWLGTLVAIFSYLGVETISVAAGEARQPELAIRRALRASVLRLLLFYLATLAVMLAIVPWPEARVETSPFVTVMRATGIPGAGAVMNFVILIAALSSMNGQLFASSRMLFSLAEAGHAPGGLATVDRAGVPARALLASSAGVAIAAALYVLAPGTAFASMIAVSIFGALLAWLMIFATHLVFRARRGRIAWGSSLGLVLMVALTATTPFTPAFRPTLAAGLPFLLLLVAAYSWLSRTRAIARKAA